MTGLIDTIPKVFRLLTKREIALPPFSVTSRPKSALDRMFAHGRGVSRFGSTSI